MFGSWVWDDFLIVLFNSFHLWPNILFPKSLGEVPVNGAVSLGSNRRDFLAGSCRTRLGPGTSTTTKSLLWGAIFSSVILGLGGYEDKVGHNRADST